MPNLLRLVRSYFPRVTGPGRLIRHRGGLNRIEGQVRGLSRMVDEDRYCIDIVTQVAAVRAALRRFEEEILRDHVAHCVEHAITAGDKNDQRKKIAELMEVVGRSQR
jgi:CsoR family transcriptional regulator, copper-sensing transcriptional repressor